eukprot:TRINITY_DN7527_c0_g2_i1.p1 TRINITY_DN7527_c0_g2~~TRINITY_DN7527_c0_g2_i1.p1  ORF type:complete len:1325 (-),score=281.07 TRINITY_DN7527_c0_g2_i1:1259-4864(-)
MRNYHFEEENKLQFSECISIFSQKCDDIPDFMIGYISSLLCNSTTEEFSHDGTVFQLLPAILSSIVKRKDVLLDGDSVSGEEAKKILICDLINRDWSDNCFIHLLQGIRDVDLNVDQTKRLISNVLGHKLIDISIEIIQDIIKELLLFGRDAESFLLSEIIDRFENYDYQKIFELPSQQPDTPQFVKHENTIVQIIDMSIRRNKKLALAFFHNLKQQEIGDIQSMQLSLSFYISNSRTKLGKQVYDYLLKSFKNALYGNNMTTSQIEIKESIENTILQVVENTKYIGMNTSVYAMIDIFFQLIDYKKYDSTTGNDVAVRCIVVLFAHCDMIRNEILDHVLSHLLTNTSTTKCINILRSIVKESIFAVAELMPKIKDIIDNFPIIGHKTSTSIIEIIIPVIELKPSLRDNLVIVLRKAIYNRDLKSRLLAVSGFGVLLKHEGIQSEEQERRAYEFIGYLRRCLSQQSEIREMLYATFAYITQHGNDRICDIMFELITPHFEIYFQPDTSPPINFKRCINDGLHVDVNAVHIIEPIDHLLFHSQLIIHHKNNNGNIESAYLARMEHHLITLVERLLTTDIEDFGIDQSVDFRSDSAVGLFNQNVAKTLHNVYEIMIQYCFESDIQDKYEKVKILFQHLSSLREIVKGANKNGNKTKKDKKKEKGERVTTFFLKEQYPLSPKFLHHAQRVMNSNEEDTIVLIEMKEFRTWLIQHIYNRLLKTNDEYAPNDKVGKKFAGNMGKTLFQEFITIVEHGQSKDYILAVLKSFQLCVQIFLKDTKNLKHLPKIITNYNDFDEEIYSSTSIVAHRIQRLISENITNSGLPKKIIEILVHILNSIQVHIPEEELKENINFMKSICDTDLGNISLIRESAKCITNMAKRNEDISIFNDFIWNALRLLGSISDIKLKKGKRYSIFNEKSVVTLLKITISQLESILSEFESSIKVKYSLVGAKKREIAQHLKEQIEVQRYEIIDNFEVLCAPLVLILQIDNCSEKFSGMKFSADIIKIVLKMLRLLTLMVKDINNVVKLLGVTPPENYSKFVLYVGQEVKLHTQTLVNHLQDTQNKNRTEKSVLSVLKTINKKIPTISYEMALLDTVIQESCQLCELDIYKSYFHNKTERTFSLKIVKDKKKKRMVRMSTTSEEESSETDNKTGDSEIDPMNVQSEEISFSSSESILEEVKKKVKKRKRKSKKKFNKPKKKRKH